MMMPLKNDLTLYYPLIGKIFEDKTGCWESGLCGCSGYIDENYDAVITDHCDRHQTIRRVVWNEEFESQCLSSDIALI